jgi:hypothetical protein
MIFTGILLSYIIDCRLVSLFDIRVKIDDNLITIKDIYNNKKIIRKGEKNNIILNTDDEINHGKFENMAFNHYKRQSKRLLEKMDENTENYINNDINNFVFNDGEKNENSDTNYNIFNNDDLNEFSNNF